MSAPAIASGYGCSFADDPALGAVGLLFDMRNAIAPFLF